MKFYKVQIYGKDGSSDGYLWATSKKAITREKNRVTKTSGGKAGGIEEVEIKPTKQGILSALNAHAAYPNNGCE